MQFIERPIAELGIDPYHDIAAMHARKTIMNVVLESGIIDESKIDGSLFSGFDGSNVTGSEYRVDPDEPVGRGILYAVRAKHWRQAYRGAMLLRDPGYYAILDKETPAIGVYDPEQFEPSTGMRWQVKDGLSIPSACTDLIVWT